LPCERIARLLTRRRLAQQLSDMQRARGTVRAAIDVAAATFDIVAQRTRRMPRGRVRALPRQRVVAYVLAQLIGAALGAWLAHAMFELPLLQ
jgi:hypothetical protein